LALLLPLAGCQPREQIDSYSVPRTTAPRQPVDPLVVREQLDATLVAIVPVGNEAWFFKITDKLVAVERQKEAVLEFLTALSTEDGEEGTQLTWELPDDWQESTEPVPMRLATLLVPDVAGPMQLAVSTLPLSGEWDGFLVRNVNRWLEQLAQSPLPSAKVLELRQEVSTPIGIATVFHLLGVDQTAASRDPHAGLHSHGASPPSTPPSTTESTEPEATGTPSTGDQTISYSEEPTENPYFTFDVPEDWQPGRTSGMRKAAFVIQDGEQQGEVTVIDLPVSGGDQVTDVLANVQRWAGQVGMEVDDAALEAMIEEITIDDLSGSYVNLVGPDELERPLSMLTAMVERDDRVWFIKLMGDRDLVAQQADVFREFLDSFRFK